MTFDEETSQLEQRIEEASARCAVRRESGPQELYMEAFDLVEALQLQLKMRLAEAAGAARSS